MKLRYLIPLTCLLFFARDALAQPACVNCVCTPITNGWSCTWSSVDVSGLSSGPHTLTVRATNASGVTAEHTITIYVMHPPQDPTTLMLTQ